MTVAMVPLIGLATPASASLPCDQELLVNRGAEDAAGATDGSVVPVPGWTMAGGATALEYDSVQAPASSDPGPPDRGSNLFAGGPQSDPNDQHTTTASQVIDVSALSSFIDAGAAEADVSGYLGGLGAMFEDSAKYSISFRGAGGSTLSGGTQFGPVTQSTLIAAGAFPGLMPVSGTTPLPEGTRSIVATLTFHHAGGDSFANGYADELSLVVVCPADISVSATQDPGATPDPIYTVEVSNGGPGHAPDVHAFMSTTPANEASLATCVVTATEDCSDQADYSGFSPNPSLVLGPVTAGDTVAVKVRVDSIHGSSATPQLEFGASDGGLRDPDLDNNNGSIPMYADISVSATQDPGATPDPIYTVEVSNGGPGHAPDVHAFMSTTPANEASLATCVVTATEDARTRPTTRASRRTPPSSWGPSPRATPWP